MKINSFCAHRHIHTHSLYRNCNYPFSLLFPVFIITLLLLLLLLLNNNNDNDDRFVNAFWICVAVHWHSLFHVQAAVCRGIYGMNNRDVII